MPSLLGTDIAKNYEKFVINTSDAGREVIVSVERQDGSVLTDAHLLSVYRQLTKAQGAVANALGNNEDGPDAFTFTGFGTADGSAYDNTATTKVFFRLQGTGTVDTSNIVVGAVGTDDITITEVAVFAPAR